MTDRSQEILKEKTLYIDRRIKIVDIYLGLQTFKGTTLRPYLLVSWLLLT